MDALRIIGGQRLSGRITISGAKNSALKLMVACLLTDQPVTLRRVPNLADTRFLRKLLETLGVTIVWPADCNECLLNANNLTGTFAPYEQVSKMRASFNVLGALLARVGQAKVSLPGGCAIGARPVNLHLKALRSLGADLAVENGYVVAKSGNGLNGAKIVFPFKSVGATEHTMMAATLARGETLLENAACEPEISDLANCLNSMGAKIEGAGTTKIAIQGVERLNGTEFEVMPDRIEAGTYAIAAAATGGDVTLENAPINSLSAPIERLESAGLTIGLDTVGQSLRIQRDDTRIQSVNIDTRPYPGFPSDLQAQFMALMCLADGTSVIRENIFENRYMHAPELSRLGGNIQVRGREAIVKGCETLRGAQVMATDLRASVSLVIAGLAAVDDTTIHRIYHLDRGFEQLEKKLTSCGANIQRYRES